jgi:nitroreductase
MEFMEVISKRISIRKYKPDTVSDADIEYVLEAARLAPSWKNTQCWKFIVVKDKMVKDDLATAGNGWIAQAPVVIAVCADPTNLWC